jgi:hypothetical protein
VRQQRPCLGQHEPFYLTTHMLPASAGLGGRAPSELETDGQLTGERLASCAYPDEDVGLRRPAAIMVIAEKTAGELASVASACWYESAWALAGLRCASERLATWQRRHSELSARVETVITERAEAAATLSEQDQYRRFAGGLRAFLNGGLLTVLLICDTIIAEKPAELLGLATLPTWVAAVGIGLAQLVCLHALGAEHAAWATRDKTAGRWYRVVSPVFVALAALGAACFVGWLRAETVLSMQAESGGVIHLNSIGLFATFFSLQVLLDAVSFLAGQHLGSPAVRALSGTRQRVWTTRVLLYVSLHRLEQATQAMARSFEAALLVPAVWRATAYKVVADRRVEAAGLYDGFCSRARPAVAAVFAEQLDGLHDEIGKELAHFLKEADLRESEIRRTAQALGYPPEDRGTDRRNGRQRRQRRQRRDK